MPDLERAQVVQLPHDALDECRLSFTVFTDERYFLAAADGEGHVMEHVMLPEILTQLFHDQREITASRSRREA